MTLIDRLMGREPARKATFGGPLLSMYASDLPLSVMGGNEQQRMAAYLRAYKVGWFYKGGKKIADDVAGLTRTLSYEDQEGDNAEEIVAPPLMVEWERLDPLEQFLRLMERPNPYETGRTLFKKTQIRSDFAGLAFWYLEGGEDGQLPTGLYGISPTRMWASVSPKGALIGWVMDKDDRGGGTPFTTDEILAFVNPGVDDGFWTGQGIVEAVYANVPLSTALAKHTGTVLTLGGRLAGMMWPRERTLSEDEYVDAQRAWRSVASDPDAAKRMLIFPEPMEYAAGAATPQEIGIPELAKLTMDEILTAFPISPYQLGVPMPGGLNSAETRKEDRRDYYLGTIHPRVELLEETIQWGLINRYEQAIGRSLDFDIEEPNLDDAASLTAKAAALEKLWALGFDDKSAISAAGLDHIEWAGKPEPPPPPPVPSDQAMMQDQQAPTTSPTTMPETTPNTRPKAVKAIRRNEVIGAELPGFQSTMEAFLHDQRARIMADIERELSGKIRAERKAAPPGWWDQEREDGLLRETLRGLYVRLARTALRTVAEEVGRVVYAERINGVAERMLRDAGKRITGINETTRKAVEEQITEGTRRGYSPAQIANGVFVPDRENYPGIRGATAFDDARAELVARTETMLAYNQSALLGYKEFNVTEVEAIDGDYDPECAERDGQTFSIDDALAIEDHPNGTLDWVPLTGDKAVDVNHIDRMRVERDEDGRITGITRIHEEGSRHVEGGRHNDRMLDLALKAMDRPMPEIHITNQAPPDKPDREMDEIIDLATKAIEAAGQQPEINITNPPPDMRMEAEQAEAWKAISMMATREPVVNVYPPDITVTTPDVHVTTPDITVLPAEVTVHPADVNVTLPSDRRGTERIERDEEGRITGISRVSRTIERDADGRITGITED